MTNRLYRFLFCIPTTQLSGGVKIILTLTDMLVEDGHHVDLFSYANSPEWFSPKANLIPDKDLSAVDMNRYDFVVVSNAFFIPMVLPLLGSARCVFFAQDYESFHHAVDTSYESFLAESESFKALYSLPVPIIATARPIARLIDERIGKKAYLISLALNKKRFKPKQREASARKRILFVGNYLMPYKGMRDGLDALEMLQNEMDIELVLVTQEERGRKLFDRYSFPKEIHFCPAETEIPDVIASCDAYCCTSWYEGLGLPALEAFCCGVPVVSTRTIGVDDYAKDGVNLLLANANDPRDLKGKLQRVLSDHPLALQLVEGGFATIRDRYDWKDTHDGFMTAIAEIDSTYEGAGQVDNGEMRRLLADLEREGSLTPIETFREFQRLASQLTNISKRIANSPSTRDEIGALEVIRDTLAPYTTNQRAQYYPAFKAKYDLCLLMLELAGTPEEIHIPRLLNPKSGASAATNAAPLTEFRYTQS